METIITSRIKNESCKLVWHEAGVFAMKQMFDKPEGSYQITIKEVKSYRGTRYKYYFGHVLFVVVQYMNEKGINQIVDPVNGELIPLDVESLHDYHKQIYNPSLIPNILKKPDCNGVVNDFLITPMSTTKLTDSQFITNFEEIIISDYANQFGITFLGRDEYAEYCKDNKTAKQIYDILN